MPGRKADINKGKIGHKKAVGALQSEMDKLKVLSRHELKHDLEYLHTANDLRQAAAEGDKQARKFMKLKQKHEAAYEATLQAEEEQIQAIEALKRGENMNVDTAEPSLYHVINYLANYFVRFLPTAKCLGCNERLVCKMKESIEVDAMRPERSYCGHWMHY